MPTPIALAIGLIGGGLIAVKAFEHKDVEPGKGENFNPNGDTANPNLAANSEALGYQTISQETYDAQGGVEAGQTITLPNGSTVTAVEGGNEVVQMPDGSTHVRTSDDDNIEIDPLDAQPNPKPIQKALSPNITTVSPIAKRPAIAFVRPKTAVSSTLADQRIRAAQRAGMRIPG